jgi:hypothetical protein
MLSQFALSMACAAVLLSSFFVSAASTLVAPTDLAAADSAYGSGVLRASGYRQQTAYGAVHFPADVALVITELRYRPDYFYGSAFTTTIGNIEFRLSTTGPDPDNLSTLFSENVGPDETVVFSGPLSISSQFSGPDDGPKNFDIVVPLTTPFLYNPAAGSLLVDIRNFSGAPLASPVAGQFSSTDSAARRGGSIGSLLGGADSGAEAIQITYTATNRPPAPLRLLRGPYLQNATVSNIVVRWRTGVPTNGVVRFGLTNGALGWAITNAAYTTEHSVTLTNLSPATRYFYSIASTETNLAGGSEFYFSTPHLEAKPIRIWAMGDFGTTPIYGNGALGVRDAYYAYTAGRYTDLWLMLGDNAYPNGTDQDFQRGLFDVYPEILRQTASWSCIGNHETYGSNSLGHIAYYDIYDHPSVGEGGGVPSGTERYYSFNYGNIHFVSLDSEFSDRTATGPMATWLQEDLLANSNHWIIVYWHSPPYTKGSHDSDNDLDTSGHLKDMREVFVPILDEFGVDLVLGGHSHIYERSYPLYGHYGKSTTLTPAMVIDNGNGRPDEDGAYMKSVLTPEGDRGTVYVVAGSGGFATYQNGVHPAMFATILETGSMVIDVEGNRLDAKFLRETGLIQDSFTIIKQGGPEQPRILSIRVDGAVLTVVFTSQQGRRYQVQHTTSLSSPNWQPVGGEINATGATTSWPGTASTVGNHFYRVVLLPN